MTHDQIIPFIQPHQLNFIRERVRTLVGTYSLSGDPQVVEIVKLSMLEKIMQNFSGLSKEQKALLEEAAQVRDGDEMKQYIAKLAAYVIPLPTITPAEIKKLFPKVKKLVLPDLGALDYTKLTYIGWRDIATNSLYLVHRIAGKWVGTECKYVLGPKNRKFVCTWCNRARQGDEAAMVTTQVKNKTIVDGYTSFGNHICLNSEECNRSMTSTDEMYAFLHRVKNR